jgi:hypothetical protein
VSKGAVRSLDDGWGKVVGAGRPEGLPYFLFTC